MSGECVERVPVVLGIIRIEVDSIVVRSGSEDLQSIYDISRASPLVPPRVQRQKEKG